MYQALFLTSRASLEEADTPGKLKNIVSPWALMEFTRGMVGEWRKDLDLDTREG